MTTPGTNLDLVHLQHANVFQLTEKGVRYPYRVRRNITGETIATLPAELTQLTEMQVFAILDFARKFELVAFNVGIKHGKKLAKEAYDPVINTLNERIRLATEENEKIASHLDTLTQGA